MLVDQINVVFAVERQATGEQLVESDAQRVEIRTKIHGSIHPAGLFRREIRQGSLECSVDLWLQLARWGGVEILKSKNFISDFSAS